MIWLVLLQMTKVNKMKVFELLDLILLILETQIYLFVHIIICVIGDHVDGDAAHIIVDQEEI